MVNMEAFNWCMENNVTIYLEPLKKSYTVNKMYGKTKKKIQVPYVNIVANLDGNITVFNKEEYRQDDEYLPTIINKLYTYYYERAKAKLR